MRSGFGLGLALFGAAACAGAARQRRPAPEPVCPTLRPPVFAETDDPCSAGDTADAGEPASCVPERSRGRLLVRDDELGIRVFQACQNQPSGERGWTVGVDPRRVMVERMGRRPPTPDELATVVYRLPHEGSRHGEVSFERCPPTDGPKPDGGPLRCLTVRLVERDLPTVTRMLGNVLRDVADACLPLTVELGVPAACLPGPQLPLSGPLK